MATYCKYYKEEEYISIDGGITWTAMGVYRKGDLLEYDSPDCTPTPTFDGKFKATYSGGRTYSAACDGDTTLTSGNTKPSGSNYSAMTTAEIGDCVTSIGNMAFSGCSRLTNIDIPDSITSIGSWAFSSCRGLTSCTIGSGVTNIGNGAFYDCRKLASINIPNSVISIGRSAFYDCRSLPSIVIPDSVTSIDEGAFRACNSLTSCTLSNSITSLSKDIFYECGNLTNIDIPSGVTSIGNYAFDYCRSLTSCTINAVTPPTASSNIFRNTPIESGTGYIYVQNVEAYKAASGWSTYTNQIRPIT